MKHIDAHLHTRGETEYLDDVHPPADMVHVAVFGSTVAHGRIRSLNLDRARRIDGVLAILTASDIPGRNRLGPVIQDEQLLAEDEVCYVGQPIALVVADSADLARKAVAGIEIQISKLPVILDPREAFARGDLIAPIRTIEMGDVDAAWDTCDVVVEGRCDIGGQEHLYLETNRARAIPREDGAVLIHSSTQRPAAAQNAIATILGVPMHKVEVDVKRLGGGFGGKEDQGTHWAAMAAVVATTLQRPVELVLNRLEDIRMTGKRHPYSNDFKIGVKNDGPSIPIR